MVKRLVLLSLLLASCVHAVTFCQTPVACTPIQLSDPQGRPIPNAIVTVLNTDGTAPPAFCYDLAGTQQFTSGSKLVSSQVLQLFGTAGTYSVNVSGAGITKVFDMICTMGVASIPNVVSIDRTADLLQPSTSHPPTGLTCSGELICYLDMPNLVDSWAYFDFIMPSTSMTFSSLLLSMRVITPGAGVFEVCACTYAVGQLPCQPSSAGLCTPVIVGQIADFRTDITISPNIWPVSWNVNDHVNIVIEHLGSSNQDTASDILLENARLEFTR